MSVSFYDAFDKFRVPLHYQSLQPLGIGAFGQVCRAVVPQGVEIANNAYFKRRSIQQVAIKRIDREIAFADSYHAKQIYREILLLKQLIHDNVVKLLDLFVDDLGHIYIVSEAMVCDLSRAMAAKQSGGFALLESHVVSITYQMLRGLKYIHSSGVVHRDLKPQNILLDDNLTVRICDFGLARTSWNENGNVTGYVTTRWYRAPEVMLTWRHYTYSLDIWSVGCIMAEMLNCVRDHVTHVDSKTKQQYYAVFPAPGHVEHLEYIFGVLGAPSATELQHAVEPNVMPFVQSKIEQLEAHPLPGYPGDLAQYFHNVDAQAVSLMKSLLAFDKSRRPTAELALEHSYLGGYHDISNEPTRNPIINLHEDMEASTDQWRQMILEEISTLSVLQDGGVQPFPAFDDISDLSDFDLFPSSSGFEHQMSLEEDHDAIDATLQLFPVTDLAVPQHDSTQRVAEVIDQLRAEESSLETQLRTALPAQIPQLQQSLDEVRTRMQLYYQQLQQQTDLLL